MPNFTTGYGNPPPWATTAAIQDVNFSGFNISNVGTINGFTPGPSGGGGVSNVSAWSAFPAICTINAGNRNISNVSTLNFQGLNHIMAPGDWAGGGSLDAITIMDPITKNPKYLGIGGLYMGQTAAAFATAACIERWGPDGFVAKSLDTNGAASWNYILASNGSMVLCNVVSINGSAYPPTFSASNWASFAATQNVNMASFSLVNLNSINGSTYSATSNWATFSATSNVNMNQRSIFCAGNVLASTIGTLNINVSSVNGAVYPPAGGGSVNTWAAYPALSPVNMNSNDLGGATTINGNRIIALTTSSVLLAGTSVSYPRGSVVNDTHVIVSGQSGIVRVLITGGATSPLTGSPFTFTARIDDTVGGATFAIQPFGTYDDGVGSAQAVNTTLVFPVLPTGNFRLTISGRMPVDNDFNGTIYAWLVY